VSGRGPLQPLVRPHSLAEVQTGSTHLDVLPQQCAPGYGQH